MRGAVGGPARSLGVQAPPRALVGVFPRGSASSRRFFLSQSLPSRPHIKKPLLSRYLPVRHLHVWTSAGARSNGTPLLPVTDVSQGTKTSQPVNYVPDRTP